MLARELQAEAKSAGHIWATVRRAKDVIGVRVKRDGFGKGGAWCWSLPAIDVRTIGAIDAGREKLSAYKFYGDGERLCDPIDGHPSPKNSKMLSFSRRSVLSMFACDVTGNGVVGATSECAQACSIVSTNSM